MINLITIQGLEGIVWYVLPDG